MKPEMGIFAIYAKAAKKYYLEGTPNLKGTINSGKFKLTAGNHPNRELQKDWQAVGEENFIIEILETLEYDKDESKTDYTEDLALLQMIWEEKLAKENIVFYKK